MPQSLGRKDKRQALAWLAVCGAGRGRGLRRAQGELGILGTTVFPVGKGARWPVAVGNVVRRERGLEFRSISEPSWSVLSQVLLDRFPAGAHNRSIFFLSFLDPSEWRRDFSSL